jgi:hypothetical protein
MPAAAGMAEWHHARDELGFLDAPVKVNGQTIEQALDDDSYLCVNSSTLRRA